MHLVIPVKRFSQAKGRLAASLSPHRRSLLARAMLEDLLDQALGVTGLDGIVLVSDEAELDSFASRYRFQRQAQDVGSADLNAVLTTALGRLSDRGVRRVMLLHADLPLAERADLQALVDRHASDGQHGLALVPDRADDGTNALICSLPLAFTLRYGKDSFSCHHAHAAVCGIDVTVERIASLALDIDHADDLAVLLRQRHRAAAGCATRTLDLLTDWAGDHTRTAEQSQASLP